jgi:hypothetical protein
VRRPILAAAAAFALAGPLALGGCGSDGAGPSTTASTAPTATAPTATAAAGGGGGAGLALVRKANRYYAETPRLTVVITSAEQAGAFSVRYDLDHGKATASVSDFGSGDRRVVTVTSPAGAFRRSGDARCWTRAEAGPLPATPFGILTRGLRTRGTPRPAGDLVRVDLVRRDPDTGEVTRGWATIDPDTGRIGTIADGDLVTEVETLDETPPLPETTPICP